MEKTDSSFIVPHHTNRIFEVCDFSTLQDRQVSWPAFYFAQKHPRVVKNGWEKTLSGPENFSGVLINRLVTASKEAAFKSSTLFLVLESRGWRLMIAGNRVISFGMFRKGT